MARVRRWATTRTTIGLATDPPDWYPLIPPADAVAGVTVLRVIASLQVGADLTGSVTRPITTTVGVLVGPEPGGGELSPGSIASQDWLWLGGDTTWPVLITGNDGLLTHPASPINRIGSRGARRLQSGENVWLIWDAGLEMNHIWNLTNLASRVLYLEP